MSINNELKSFYSKPHSVLMASVEYSNQLGGGNKASRIRTIRKINATKAPQQMDQNSNIGSMALGPLAKYGDVGASTVKLSAAREIDENDYSAKQLSKKRARESEKKVSDGDFDTGSSPKRRKKASRPKKKRQNHKQRYSRLDRLLGDNSY